MKKGNPESYLVKSNEDFFFILIFIVLYRNNFCPNQRIAVLSKDFCLLVLIKHYFIKALFILTAKEIIGNLKTATNNP